jgi:glycosyltransferase involved in cell wall biosynthesis
MRRTVIFYLGAWNDAMLNRIIFRDYADILERFGVYSVDIKLNFLFLEEVEQMAASLPDRLGLYCVADSNFFSLRSTDLTRSKLITHFSDCQVSAFLSLVRQDRALDAYLAWSCLRGLADNAAWFEKLVDYAAGLRHVFRLFGRQNTSVYVASDGKDARLLAQQAFWRCVGVPDAEGEISGIQCVRPQFMFDLQRDFLCFARGCSTLTEPGAWEESPWLHQSLRFGDPNAQSFFSPQKRRAYLDRFAASNAEAARLLGLDRLFPDPVPEPDWEPFSGLTPESAFRVAERLDRDFARDRMADFDAAPVHHLTRDQRICRVALHDALAPPSAAPLLRVQSPEPKLSVLTLTYNHADFIAQNIESVLEQQTNFPFQHIIADDGSDDGTQEIILDYAAKHPQIVPVIRKDRNAPWSNVRALFGMARTEYVALCDGDDYLTDPAKLQIQADFLDEHKDCALCFHIVRVTYEDEPGKERLYPPVEELPRGIRPFYYLSDLVRCNIIQTNSVMYRWRFKDGLPDWFRSDLCPGDWYWHLLHAEQGKIGFINKVMSVYRRHAKGLYFLSETNRLRHRYAVGMSELEMYDTVNKHFGGKYQSILSNLANGVMDDWLLYSEQEDTASLLETVAEKYPDFARNFLSSLKKVSAR